MKTLSRSEFESLISEKSPKIITRNREVIKLTKDQALEWADGIAGWSHNEAFIAESNYGVFVGYDSVDSELIGVTWYKIGGNQ